MARDFPGHVLEVRGRGLPRRRADGLGLGALRGGAPRARPADGAVAGLNVIRLLPPLNASAEELARSVAIFRDALGSR
jgi:hypothetical protein